MSLLDLAPDAITIGLKGKEYTMEYSYMSLRELEVLYGTEEEYAGAARKFMVDPANIKRTDIINFLYAGLIHTDLFAGLIDKRVSPWRINREGCKEFISTFLVQKETPKYMLLIIASWANSNISKEIAEILEVMAEESEKKSVVTEGSGINDTQ